MIGLSRYTAGLQLARAIADAADTEIIMLGTSPCHNCAAGDDDTVVALNRAASSIAAAANVSFVDLYT